MSSAAAEKNTWVYWLQIAKILTRLVAALFILCAVARPILEGANNRIFNNKDFATVFFAEPAGADSSGTSSPTGNTTEIRYATTRQTSPKKSGNIAANAPTPLIWAYGIQVFGLVASLGVTLWAVVALVRSD